MSGFGDIIGHEDIIWHLKNAILAGKVSHAYILSGEEGSGKRLLADTFAMALQCEQGGTEPCMQCRSCRQAASGSQPDIIHVVHEKPASIGVEDIRGQVNGDIAIKPYRSPYKIYIIDEADKMTVQAQNALLKTIEEPPSYAVLILLADNADRMLPTILSRCIRLNLKAVSSRLMKEYLMDKMKIPDYQADLSVTFAQGNVGKAMKLASSDKFQEMKEQAVRLLGSIEGTELHDLPEAVKELGAYKENIQELLDLFTLWFRDVLLFKATQEAGELIFRDELAAVRRQAKKSSYEGLEEILNGIERARARLRANVNFDLTMELLLLTIKEN